MYNEADMEKVKILKRSFRDMIIEKVIDNNTQGELEPLQN